MAHKREYSVKHDVGDYVLMRTYGKKKFYLAQVKQNKLHVCRIDFIGNQLEKTNKIINYSIRSTFGTDIVVKNFGSSRKIDIHALESEYPELLLQLL